jgi:hypothetical protein
LGLRCYGVDAVRWFLGRVLSRVLLGMFSVSWFSFTTDFKMTSFATFGTSMVLATKTIPCHVPDFVEFVTTPLKFCGLSSRGLDSVDGVGRNKD